MCSNSNSALIFTARNLNVETRINTYTNPVPENMTDTEVLDIHFQNLKKRGFCFDVSTLEMGIYKGDNYGNYSLELINLGDFKEIEAQKTLDNVKTYMNNLFKNMFQEMTPSHDLYVESLISALRFFLSNPKYCFELDVEKLAQSNKFHPHYSLWEHFKTYLFFFNDGMKDNMVILQIGFD